MKNVLALGSAACNIVDSLKKYDTYKIYKIQNNETENKKQEYTIPDMSSPEEYEDLDVLKEIKFLKQIKDEVTFFVCGASRSSAMALRILESIHKRGVRIKVVYFQPEIDFLSDEQALQERAVKGILQQYARSGLFDDILLVSNKVLESFVGSINVLDYYKQINEVFCDSYHMLEVFKNTKPVMSTFSRIRESCRVKTMGVSTISCEDRLFFPFKQEVEVLYYFGINEEKLKTEGNFFKSLTTSVRSRMSGETKAYFGIYPTEYESDYIYVEYFSPKIQETTFDTESIK